MSEKEALLQTKRIFCNSAPPQAMPPPLRCTNAQNHQDVVAQWNRISRTCNIPKHWKSTKTRSYL